MAREIIGFVMGSKWLNKQPPYGEFCGKYNGYVAVPNELVRKEWYNSDYYDDWEYPVYFPHVHEITACWENVHIRKENILKCVHGNADILELDNSYTIFGWDYSHIWNTPENSTLETVVKDILDTIQLVKKDIEK